MRRPRGLVFAEAAFLGWVSSLAVASVAEHLDTICAQSVLVAGGLIALFVRAARRLSRTVFSRW